MPDNNTVPSSHGPTSPGKAEQQLIAAVSWIARSIKTIANVFKVLGRWGRAAWVFAVPASVVAIALLVFWFLDQGKDLLISAADHYPQTTAGAFATVFMAYVTWYVARMLANSRSAELEHLDGVYYHAPRVLGFSVFSIVLIGLWGTLGPGSEQDGHFQWIAALLCLPTAYHLGAALIFFIASVRAYPQPPATGLPHFHRDRLLLTLVIAELMWLLAGTGAAAKASWLALIAFAGVVYPLFVHWSLLIAKAVPGDSDESKRKMRGLTLLLIIVTLSLVFIAGIGGHALLAIGCGFLGQFVHTCYVTNRRHFSKRVQPKGLDEQKRFITWAMGILRTVAGFVGFLSPLMNLIIKPAIRWLTDLEQEFASKTDQRSGSIREDDPTAGKTNYYRILNFLTALGIAIFIWACASEDFAMQLGGAAVALFGLTTVMLILAFLGLVSTWLRVNAYLIVVALALVLGNLFETHRVDLVEHQPLLPTADQRLDTRAYLRSWIELRRSDIEKTEGDYPMYFVLADGGASRSGYWVGSVLGRLHQESNGYFTDHLFCLSGASGGSWGNGAFHAWLGEQRTARGLRSTDGPFRPYGATSMEHDSLDRLCRNTLEQDFLSFTLAHMLGNDFVGLLFPPVATLWGDRARALERTLERTDRVLGKGTLFQRPFNAFLASDARTAGELPILFINVTRMQDAKPGVISTIKLDPRSSKRIDVLQHMPDSFDMRLSTAIAMGSRFPFVSPAGYVEDDDDHHYYVDGGYFDNSGAGAVHELLLAMDTLLDRQEVVDAHIRQKLRFVVVHISNSEIDEQPLEPVSTIVNDLLSPAVTLAGSYGMQTDVNDARLKGFIESGYMGPGEFHTVNLYTSKDDQPYSMNWVISDTTRRRMDMRCRTSPDVNKLVRSMLR